MTDGYGGDVGERTVLMRAYDDERSQQMIKQAHREWLSALDAISDPIFMHDKDCRVMRSNRAYAKRAGMSVKEVVGKLYYEMFPKHDGQLPGCRDAIQREGTFEEEIKLESGEIFLSRIVSIRDDDGSYLYSLHIMKDITERKRNEENLLKLNRALRLLSKCNETLIHADDELQLLRDMCQVIVEKGGYHAAWVGYAQQDAEKTIQVVTQYGLAQEHQPIVPFSWGDGKFGQSPTGMAVRSGEIQVSQNIQEDPSCAPWCEQARQLGVASCVTLPLKKARGVFGSLSIYAAETNAFNQDETELLKEMSEDLAFGIVTLRAGEEQKQSAEKLRSGLEETVRVVATMVEMRDPYTSGHQQRVADLARAIATEMGMPEEQRYGLHLAGLIHDLGKIQIPAEILSKPGRLTETEFSLIKAHPQTGYDVLKNIKFPWPIAQIVWQHHERLDGSGYPQGLKGGDILLEARILCVADVVEAMASHRPYRPGLGLPTALDEIRKNRGKFYDSDVVDACVKLFEQNKFPPPEEWAKR